MYVVRIRHRCSVAFSEAKDVGEETREPRGKETWPTGDAARRETETTETWEERERNGKKKNKNKNIRTVRGKGDKP